MTRIDLKYAEPVSFDEPITIDGLDLTVAVGETAGLCNTIDIILDALTDFDSNEKHNRYLIAIRDVANAIRKNMDNLDDIYEISLEKEEDKLKTETKKKGRKPAN
jgi:hypothetical protein